MERGSAYMGSKSTQAYMKTPVTIPEAPQPATALPRMKAVEVGAEAHTTSPSPRMATEATKTHLTRNCS